ncbi:hypothetical protein PLANPX_3052 [Lacipirellula parvula]|uniref:Uncharacterized protein n=1 Tax=Lacipirellula parvula TaxID=2650471 RepID=A0A5K7X9P3_9BACT|nr:hypothetical protein PLANPX_3052 [Lacipirellula parvula]
MLDRILRSLLLVQVWLGSTQFAFVVGQSLRDMIIKLRTRQRGSGRESSVLSDLISPSAKN